MRGAAGSSLLSVRRSEKVVSFPSPWGATFLSLKAWLIHSRLSVILLDYDSVLPVRYLGCSDAQDVAPFSRSHWDTCIIAALRRDKTKTK